jgi:hypothetical protein
MGELRCLIITIKNDGFATPTRSSPEGEPVDGYRLALVHEHKWKFFKLPAAACRPA